MMIQPSFRCTRTPNRPIRGSRPQCPRGSSGCRAPRQDQRFLSPPQVRWHRLLHPGSHCRSGNYEQEGVEEFNGFPLRRQFCGGRFVHFIDSLSVFGNSYDLSYFCILKPKAQFLTDFHFVKVKKLSSTKSHFFCLLT